MLTPPADLDPAELAALLEGHWELRVDGLEYLPLGFGSHHWRAVGRFVTVDDLEAGHRTAEGPDAVFEALQRAFRTATSLRLDFVVAPLPDVEGEVIRRLGTRWAVTVFPYVEGESSTWGYWEDEGDRRSMLELLERLHAVRLPDGLPRREGFRIPSRAALEGALAELDREWTSGPFAEPARELLARYADVVARRLHEYDERVRRVDSAGWVVTHGEPHRGNVIRASDGRFLLVDWDTTLLAPRERDLRFVVGSEPRDSGANPETLDLYRRWWGLADTAVFVNVCRRPHEEDAQARASFENLVSDLAEL